MRNSLSVILALLLVAACTDVEFCYEGEHPHRAMVRYHYDWSNADSAILPDSMLVLAVRIVNQWKCGSVVSQETERGRYFWNVPEGIKAWRDPSLLPEDSITPQDDPVVIDPDKPDNGGVNLIDDADPTIPVEPTPPIDPYTVEVDRFGLREGTYKFLTMSSDEAELSYAGVNEYMQIVGDSMQLGDIELTCHSYDKGDTLLRRIVDDWVDYNPGFEYIQPLSLPIWFDTIQHTNILKSEDNVVTFQPHAVTQNIDIYLTLKKDRSVTDFMIDEVVAEISGIPSRINLATGNLYLAKTNKMMFPMKPVNTLATAGAHSDAPIDTYTSNELKLCANIDVLSILRSKDENQVSGPGIMQLIIKMHALKTVDGQQEVIHKKLQGKINLYHSLTEANLIHIDDEGTYARITKTHGVVDIRTDIVLKGEDIIKNSNDNGGIDDWTPSGDVPIEL